MGRDILSQVDQLLRPLRMRMANMVARAVVQLVDDSKRQQLLQLGLLPGEDGDDAEHFHPFGFYSVPLPGAEAVVLFPGGDRAHPLVVAVSDRRHRPTGGQGGEAGIYSSSGAIVRLLADGNIEVTPGPSGEVFVRSEGGSAERLVKLSEFNDHTHPAGTLAAPSGGGPVTGATAIPPAATGTQKLQAE